MKKYGLIGEKLGHSYSKVLHEELFKLMKWKYNSYDLYEINKKDIKNLRGFIKKNQLDGLNVTIPYKENVIKLSDELSKEVIGIGAANTLDIKDNRINAYNTDYYGIEYMFNKAGIYIEDRDVIVLGSGGASKAIISYLKTNKARMIYIVSRKMHMIEKKEKVNYINYEELSNLKADILINATPVGMYPNVANSPVSELVIRHYNVVVDIIYNPVKTKLIKMAEKNGIKTVGGLDMLIYQAVKAEEIWHETNINQTIIDQLKNNLIKVLKF